jgi:hypothetical protein
MKYKDKNDLPMFSKRIVRGSYTKIPELRLESDRKNLDTYMKSLIGSFISDAILMKEIEYEVEDDECESPSINKNIEIQFTKFSKKELVNYFAFRTIIIKGKIPKNNYTAFLIVYLMEIINGIYGSAIDDKVSRLKSLLKIYNKKNKNQGLLKEAFEIVYLQHIAEVSREEFFKDLPFLVFEDTLFAFSNNVPPTFSLHTILMLIDYINWNNLTDKEVFLFEECFSHVSSTLNGKLIISRRRNVNELLLSYERTNKGFDVPRDSLKTIYPITTNVEYLNKSWLLECYKYGMHYTNEISYRSDDQRQLTDIFDSVINCIRCYNKKIPTGYLSPQDNRRSEKNQDLIYKTISCWMDDNAYVKYFNDMTFEELKIKEVPKRFAYYKLDISDVNDVRKKSSEIQEKLIIEDDESDLIKQESSDSSIQSDSSFTVFDKKIIKLLLDGNIDKAIALSNDDGEMLSVVVDRINSIAMNVIGDVVIEDFMVIEDYQEDLNQML